MLRLLLALSCAATILVAADSARPGEQPLPEQPAPFTVWLDFAALSQRDATPPELPVWFKSFTSDPVAATATEPPRTNFRLRLRAMPELHEQVMLRLFYDDLPEMQPEISTWSETGRERARISLAGHGLGLATSESLAVPLKGVDYLDITVVGDGTSIRGALVTSLKETTTLQTLDFRAAPELVDPFGASSGPAPDAEDKKLFGRVKALLDAGPAALNAETTAQDWLIQLSAEPLAAMLEIEVLNADFHAPLILVINDGEPIAVNIHWPDLADPGFRGEARGGEPGMRFQYTGWLRAQAAIPGSALKIGVNKISIGLSEQSAPVALRNVELQLKHNWKHFDYILSPHRP